MLMRARQIPIVYVIFDVLSLDGTSLMGEPYSVRRAHEPGRLDWREAAHHFLQLPRAS